MRVFVTTGSRSFQFDRLIQAVDETDFSTLASDACVFAQIGSSNYVPKRIEYVRFLSREEYVQQIERADIVITHGGTGAIIGSITRGKRVIAVPRLAEYGEAVDNHQIELINQFADMNLIEGCQELSGLLDCAKRAITKSFTSYKSNTDAYIKSIEDYLANWGFDER